jgi:hypothetical protein
VTDRKKWKDLVRQAKAHSGLKCQWKKKEEKYLAIHYTVDGTVHFTADNSIVQQILDFRQSNSVHIKILLTQSYKRILAISDKRLVHVVGNFCPGI